MPDTTLTATRAGTLGQQQSGTSPLVRVGGWAIWIGPPVLAALLYPFVRESARYLGWITVGLGIYVLFFSVVVHELCHGLLAYACGDTTAKDAGRLTLNPVRHVSLVGTILVPLGLYLLKAPVLLGWARPVPFSPTQLRRYPRDQVALAAAGPLSNLVLSYLCFLVFLGVAGLYNQLHPTTPMFFHLDFHVPINLPPTALGWLWFVLFEVLTFGMLINVFLAVLNLMPLPPLDGFWLLRGLLPRKASAFLGKVQVFGFIILILALQIKQLYVVLFYPVIIVIGLFSSLSFVCLG